MYIIWCVKYFPWANNARQYHHIILQPLLISDQSVIVSIYVVNYVFLSDIYGSRSKMDFSINFKYICFHNSHPRVYLKINYTLVMFNLI